MTHRSKDTAGLYRTGHEEMERPCHPFAGSAG